ncbi:MAG TPA: alpha/beta hydrolase, partial [Accumulibacter sp.]|nr:alpha/beta hydrolase [Accumulibacter sp.]
HHLLRMARDLLNLLEHYHLQEVVVVAHSLGALTLWEYIKSHGCDRLAKICLIDQSPKLLTDDNWPFGIYGHFDAQQAAALSRDLTNDFAEAVLRLAAMGLNARARQKYEEHAPGLVRARDWLKAQYSPPLIACWETLLSTDFRPALERIDIPTLLIYGGASNYYPPETGPYLRDRLPDAELHVYEGADHSPHQCDRDRFIHDLLHFIDRS